MAFEMLVGLKIKDAQIYQQYRDAMSPLLKEYGGGFKYDFWIKETLKSESPNSIDRVFIIYFKDKLSMENFFSDINYLQIKKKFFETSVEATTIISRYEVLNEV